MLDLDMMRPCNCFDLFISLIDFYPAFCPLIRAPKTAYIKKEYAMFCDFEMEHLMSVLALMIFLLILA